MLKFLLYALFILIVIFFGIVFLSRNEAEIALDLFIAEPISLSIGLWVLISFIIGCLLAWAISWPAHLATKVMNKQQRRKLKNLQEEIVQLKGDVTKGN
mgnify:CR=1 FL=1